MSGRPPVQDWANDFDHTDPTWTEDPYPIMRELRGRCPVPHSERYGGLHAPMRYADVRTIANTQKLLTEHEMGELFKVIGLSRGLDIEPIGFARGDRTHTL